MRTRTIERLEKALVALHSEGGALGVFDGFVYVFPAKLMDEIDEQRSEHPALVVLDVPDLMADGGGW